MDVVEGVRKGIKAGGEAGVSAGEQAVEAAHPWLKLPIINWLWRSILEKFTDAIIKALMDKSTEILIPIINTHAASAAQEASDRLQKIIDEGKATEAELNAEIEKWEEKYEALIRMRRSTPD